jgi:hypothetical protein
VGKSKSSKLQSRDGGKTKAKEATQGTASETVNSGKGLRLYCKDIINASTPMPKIHRDLQI